LQNGSGKTEIVKDVLACSNQAVGLAYYEFLKGKFT